MTARNPNARVTPGGLTHTAIHDAATDTHKHCTKCGLFKPLEEFHLQKRGFKGRTPKCKECQNEYTLGWLSDNRKIVNPRARINRIRRVYGDEGVKILVRIDAGEVCEICGNRTTKMAIDHDHTSGKVRGLLCHNCNTALGLLKEDDTIISGLLAYLVKHKEK